MGIDFFVQNVDVLVVYEVCTLANLRTNSLRLEIFPKISMSTRDFSHRFISFHWCQNVTDTSITYLILCS